MKAPVIVILPWANQYTMTDGLIKAIRLWCDAYGIDYDTTAHWNVESMTAAQDGLVVCLAFFGVETKQDRV